jgi:hypothetical protein
MQIENRPLEQWMKSHKLNKQLEIEIFRWLGAVQRASDSLEESEALETWLASHKGDEPDVVSCIANYGLSRIIIRGWKKLPIDIPQEQHEHWREYEYEPTLEDVQEYIAGAAGGFLETAGHNPGETIRLIRAQVAEKAARMEELAKKPLDYYTLGEYEEEEILEDAHLGQLQSFEEVFKLREQLHCFELGMEYMRLFCFNEAPELGLPNKGLFAALGDIDLNLLIGRLDAVEEKLQRIRGHLAQQELVKLNDETAPDVFWWRHFKAPPKKEREGRHRKD